MKTTLLITVEIHAKQHSKETLYRSAYNKPYLIHNQHDETLS